MVGRKVDVEWVSTLGIAAGDCTLEVATVMGMGEGSGEL